MFLSFREISYKEFKGVYNTKNMSNIQITIFGSSRQDAIKKNFSTTNIRGVIGDTLSTKEIIQAIEFCKGGITPNTKRCFQMGFLQNTEISTEQVRIPFERTDLYVLEISTRKVYEWNGMYVPRDLTEEKYGVADIQTRSLTDTEIDADLSRIKELLGPKKILIVSHVHLRDNGERVEFIELLERLCLKYDLPFLCPSDYLYAEKNVYKKEAVLANFTDYGHSLMARIYKRVIEDIFKTKTIVFVVKQQYANRKRTNTDNFWGLGDVLRAVYSIYKTSFVSGFKVIIDISNHPISQYIKCGRHKYYQEVQNNIDNIIHFHSDNVADFIKEGFKTNDVLYMAMYSGLETYAPTDYDTDIQLFVKKNFQPTNEMKEYIQSKTNGLDLSSINIIHYRLGDKELVNGNVDANKIYLCYRYLLSVLTQKSILLTDSSTFKMLVSAQKHPNIILYEHPICHIGYDIGSEEIKNSLFEFFIATQAKSIQTYTVYGWVSGFMYSIHRIYNVPMTDMQRNIEHILYKFA